MRSWASEIARRFYVIQNNNNNDNYKTSIAPLSSKRIELNGAHSTGIGQTETQHLN